MRNAVSLRSAISTLRAKYGASHGFVRSVGTLAGGTAVAQIVTVMGLPFLTRLYGPEEFSIFAVYAALLAMLSVIACLRLEIAIPLPRDDRDAANLLALALLSSALVSSLVAIPVTLLPLEIASFLRLPEFQPYLWMVPFGVWISSSYAAVQYWSTRKKNFLHVARTRITQSVGGVGTQLISGLAGIGPVGLLLGHIVSAGAGVFSLARDAFHNDSAVLKSVRAHSMRVALNQYSRFPRYGVFEGLANTASSQLPVILIAALAAGPEAGYLLIATRVMAAPMMLIGASVGQVYLSRASEDLRAGKLGSTTAGVLGGLIKTGVGPLLFAGIIAAPVFAVVFGEDWRRAGTLATWLVPSCILQFLASPVSMVMHVRMQQGAMLLLTILGFVFRVGSVVLASKFLPGRVVEAYAIASAINYALLNIVFYRVAGCGPAMALAQVRRSMALPTAWLALGCVVIAGIEWRQA